jgi:hypothetical protein
MSLYADIGSGKVVLHSHDWRVVDLELNPAYRGTWFSCSDCSQLSYVEPGRKEVSLILDPKNGGNGEDQDESNGDDAKDSDEDQEEGE